jgi:hypothetical protein
MIRINDSDITTLCDRLDSRANSALPSGWICLQSSGQRHPVNARDAFYYDLGCHGSITHLLCNLITTNLIVLDERKIHSLGGSPDPIAAEFLVGCNKTRRYGGLLCYCKGSAICANSETTAVAPGSGRVHAS